jgi:APA family basic amino acid/polyamine antiporter
VILAVGSADGAILAWTLGGLISIAGGLTIAEVAARIPKTGGVYTYIEEIYGPTLGYLCGWVITVIYGPGLIAALSLYFGSLAAPFITAVSPTTIAIFTLLSLALINSIGAKYGGRVQRVTTVAKLIPIVAICVCGLWSGHMAIFTSSSSSEIIANGNLGTAVLSTLWAYDGWMVVANVAGEMKHPARDLPRAIIFGLLTVAVVYLAVNMALLHMLSASQLAQLNERAAGVVAEQLFGAWGGRLISLGILISIFGSLNGNILALPRVPYAMALRGELPFSKFIQKVDPRFQSPIYAIALQSALAILMILVAHPDQLTDLAIFTLYIFFALALLGLFLLRRRDLKKHELSYRTPLYPIVPLLAVVGCLFILVSTAVAQPIMLVAAIGICAVGLLVRRFLLMSQEVANG